MFLDVILDEVFVNEPPLDVVVKLLSLLHRHEQSVSAFLLLLEKPVPHTGCVVNLSLLLFLVVDDFLLESREAILGGLHLGFL